ncbi:MAG TPA: ATP-binding protein, partial [Candidatus Tenderia sp.]|nr:ATP-binding protein [Candidatus Tenderia sp.]
DFHKFTDEKQEDVHHEVDDLQTQLQNVFNQIPQWRREAKAQLKALNEEVAGRVIDQMVDEVRQQFAAFPEVLGYLDALHNDLIQSVEDFRSEGEQEAAHLAFGPNRNSLFQRYQVNVLVDHGDTAGAPVVYEDNPTYQNLVGRIDHQSMMGTLFTDFTLIKAGALHRANHGYLVLDAFKLLQHPFSWEALKRALSASEIHVSTLEQMLSLVSTVTLDPQPIPLEVKVVLVGDRHLYYMLYQLDPEFKELFKVAADFEDEVQRSDSNNALYARMIGTMVKRQGLKPFDRGGVARVIEHGARLVEDAEKLTTHRRSVADLLCEADYWAAEAGREVVGREDVQHAIDAQMHRAGRMMENIQESILRHQLMIDTEGERVGQVNGLTVMELGDLAFGAPSRITARVRMGDGELIDIEREVDMGGPIHSKGVLILSGFLGQRYVYETPLALSASLVFEQSYGEVEGDSASAGELFALLSAISGLPLTQAVAVTGSVNQHGEIQPIGGVNEKIEGFFDICKQRGFAPGQGVLIPAANRSDLMLKEEVVAAARQGLFSVYAITTIDEGIELLTGVAAGEADAEGQYPEASVNAAVARQLLRFARIRHEFGDDKKEEQDDDHDRGEAADKVHHDEAKERP